ncbi:peptidylprolyl isomerase [Qipengyuania algicida]|uniref:peptidylprolyl isomerase n=1 Tax=Qipengyuania algicida TaxID=1836209 RepID=UPI00301BC959
MKLKTLTALFPATAAAALVLSGVAVHAQDTASDTQESADNSQDNGSLNLPSDIKMLGENNPNVRTATAVVNGHVITGTDVDQRVALVVAANKGKVSSDEMQRLRAQVLRNLIDETLEIQEAKAQKIDVTPEEVEQSYQRVAAQNFGQNPGKMDAYLKSVGSSPASLKRQIEGEIAWQKLLRRNIQPFVNVSNGEVNDVLKQMEASKGTEEYRLGEIYLSATPETSASVEQNAEKIVDQLKKGGSFAAYARQFSEASTAAVGGDLGWVRLATLPTEMATVAREMQPGQLVGPFQIPGGWEIMLLIDKRQVLTADPRDAVLSLKQISIAFKPGISEDAARAQVQKFAEGVKQIKGCGDVDREAQALGASVVENNQVRARALPAQLQDAVLNLKVGQTTPPFGSVQDGVRVLMLCGRDDPEQVDKPDFESVMNKLEDERINKRAQRYLRDLRSDAYIEYN